MSGPDLGATNTVDTDDEVVPVVDSSHQCPPESDLHAVPQQPARVVLALGGNLGDVVATLRHAVDQLFHTVGLEVLAVAPLARTQAVTMPDAPTQPDYLNTVVVARTSLSPRAVLDVCHDLENEAGRERTHMWGPRTLDVDLIDYEGVTSTDPTLTLPHPRAHERAFVLLPWSMADPDAVLADHSVAQCAAQAPDREGVRWLALEWTESDALPSRPAGHFERADAHEA